MTSYSTTTVYTYSNDTTYLGLTYSRPYFAYQIIVGSLSAIGNLFVICLFLKYFKLRAMLCNWLIIYLCIPDVFIGIACVYRTIIQIIVLDNNIVGFNYVLCNVLQIPFGLGYRIGQTIALMIAMDRLVAIWKPTVYAKQQIHNIYLIIFSAIFIIIDFLFLIFLHFYGVDASIPLPLSNCFRPNGTLFYVVIPTYSGVISILFIIVYVASLVIFMRRVSERRKINDYTHKNLSNMQIKVFTSVSLALLCYSIAYVVPTLSNMLTYYFHFPTWVNNIYSYSVGFGAELNGFLNSVIYITKHSEFKECAIKFIRQVTGRPTIFESSKIPTAPKAKTSTNHQQFVSVRHN